jgi:hypothetical protein
MSKANSSQLNLTGRLAGFDPNTFASEFVSVEEVLEIKKAFDLFDYDGGASIDPKGNSRS